MVEPLSGGEINEAMSSPLADGPAEEKFEPFCDFASVEEVWLPLRFLLMYFSIASASRSRIRVAMGDSEKVGPVAASKEDCVGAGDCEKVLLLAEEACME